VIMDKSKVMGNKKILQKLRSLNYYHNLPTITV
jgi:hypothetical protein